MKAIILAAGAGKRLAEISQGLPKCLLKIGSTTLLEHQLESIRSAGITHVVVVVGYKKEEIMSFLKNSTLHISYIFNEEYLTSNTIYSLWLAREYMETDFLYFNADVLADKMIVQNLIDSLHPNVLAIERKLCRDEEVKVILDGTDKIIAIGKTLETHKCAGEFIGIGKFSSTTNKLFIECLEQYVNAGEKNLFFETAVNKLSTITDIHSLDIKEYPSVEIDFPEDYYRALELVEKLTK